MRLRRGQLRWEDLPLSLQAFKALCRRRNWLRREADRRSVGSLLRHERERQIGLGIPREVLDAIERELDVRPRCRHCRKPWP